jgi:raffinose/stachyose/melibiose transport system permease protein
MVLTNGAPKMKGVFTTEMMALNIAKSFSTANQRGAAQAKAVLFFILVAAISIIQLTVTHRKEVQQ